MAAPETVAKCIVTMVMAYPDANVPIETQRVYKEALADIPDEALKLATTQIIATSKWFPKIAELREAAAQLQLGSGELMSGDEAWGDCLKTLRQLGYYEVPVFSNKAITKAVEAVGGWRYLRESNDDMADRSHFVKAYDQIIKRELREAELPPVLQPNSPALLQMRGLAKQLNEGNKK